MRVDFEGKCVCVWGENAYVFELKMRIDFEGKMCMCVWGEKCVCLNIIISRRDMFFYERKREYCLYVYLKYSHFVIKLINSEWRMKLLTYQLHFFFLNISLVCYTAYSLIINDPKRKCFFHDWEVKIFSPFFSIFSKITITFRLPPPPPPFCLLGFDRCSLRWWGGGGVHKGRVGVSLCVFT